MARDADLKRLAQGREAWNIWAAEQLAARDALEAAGRWDPGLPLGSASEKWASGASVDLRDHQFKEVFSDFSGFVFPWEARFSRAEFHGEVLFSSAVFHGPAHFGDAEFHADAEFEKAEFKDIGYFSVSRFMGRLSFEACRARTLAFEPAWFSGDACFAHARLGTFRGNRAVFHAKADFRNTEITKACHMDDALFHEDAEFSGADLGPGARMRRVHFVVPPIFAGARFGPGALFHKSLASQADFAKASAHGMVFDQAVLPGANFTDAGLIEASFVGADLDYRTTFAGAVVGYAKIDRYALESMENYGGLTVGARMEMDIQDDVATLRSEYSGFLGWLHLLALVGFVFPYAWFVFVQWGRAEFISTDTSIAMWEALARFIYNGGQNWQSGWSYHPSFLLFCAALAYNLLRAILLKKTKDLEMQQVTSGLPARFSLTHNLWGLGDPEIAEVQTGEAPERPSVLRRLLGALRAATWQHVFLASRYGFYVYLAVVLFNLAHFMTMRVPVAP